MSVLSSREVFDGEEAVEVTLCRAAHDEPGLVRALLDIDLQSFAESTFSEHMAAAFAAHAAVFLLRTHKRPIGSCVVLRGLDDPGEAILVAMSILPGWRGRGLGEWMLACVHRELARLGFSSVVLHVGARNQRALRVYHEVGFQTVHEDDDPIEAGERRLRLRATLCA
ncbi:MAG TPA: GNAT family N-acetyltransferase [Myxococcota bacterium]|nr:GNAT family N-acetyltransferase [Myxococcota bacterium]